MVFQLNKILNKFIKNLGNISTLKLKIPESNFVGLDENEARRITSFSYSKCDVKKVMGVIRNFENLEILDLTFISDEFVFCQVSLFPKLKHLKLSKKSTISSTIICNHNFTPKLSTNFYL